MNAAARLGNLAGIDCRDFEAARFQLLDQRPRRRGGNDLGVAERHEVAAEGHRVLERHVDDIMPFVLQPSDDSGIGAFEADGGELLGDRHDHQVDMDVIFVDEGEAGFPAFPVEPFLDLAGGFLVGAGAAAADQHHAVLDDIEIAAFEGAGGDHVVDRDAERLIGADRGIVLAAPPPLSHGCDDGAIGRHDRGITGIDLHRQFRRRLVPVDLHAKMLVGGSQFLMLGLGGLDVAGIVAQVLARERRGRQMLEIGR